MITEEFDDYQDMRNPNGHPDRIKGNMTPHPQLEYFIIRKDEWEKVMDEWVFGKLEEGRFLDALEEIVTGVEQRAEFRQSKQDGKL